MKRVTWVLGIIAVGFVATAIAQPPGGPGGGGPGGQGPGGGMGGPPPSPVIEALDKDHDHVVSSDELKNATSSLLTLDKNNDGKLTENEFGPQAGRGMGAAGGRAKGGGTGKRQTQGAQGGPGGRPQGAGPGGPEGGPNPERMVDHAMEFDTDNDGKLSREELTKFAEDFAKHRPGPSGPPGGEQGGPGLNNNQPSERPKRPD